MAASREWTGGDAGWSQGNLNMVGKGGGKGDGKAFGYIPWSLLQMRRSRIYSKCYQKIRKWRRRLGKMEGHMELHKEEIEMLESGTMREGKD